MDFYEDGLSGRDNSSDKRKKLLKKLNLPENLSQNALIKVLNKTISYDEYKRVVEEL